MKVYFVGEKQSFKFRQIVKKSIEAVREELSQPKNISVCVNFVGDEEIRELNKIMRNVDKTTDVLSFPTFELKAGEILDTECLDARVCAQKGIVPIGDMAMNLAQLSRQAVEFGVTLESELSKLVVHSALHLFGYDHIDDKDFAIMQPLEEKIKCKMTKC